MTRNRTRPRSRIGLSISTSYFVDQIHNHWINLVNREIWIHGADMNTDDHLGLEPGVEYRMATKVIKNLHILRQQSESEPATIHLHTCGGTYEEGMAIYDAIKLMPYPVTIISYTHARSMSSIIFQAGDKRLMMPNSCFMFHLGTMELAGDARTVWANADFAKVGRETMINIYVESAHKGPKFKGWSRPRIRRLIEREMEKKSDVFLIPKEAIDWGFADGILTKWPS